MTKEAPALYFWDSCVFIRYLTGTPTEYVADITRMIADAKRGAAKIYCSTMAFAEIKPSHLRRKDIGDITALAADLRGSFFPIGPTPDILEQAGALRDISFPHPNGGKPRVMGIADAIHLLTCAYAEDVLQVGRMTFHTLDAGKGSTWEGKCVPLLGLEQWAVGLMNDDLVNRVCRLDRSSPKHPTPGMFDDEA